MGASTTLRFRLPDLGEGVAETEIVRWLVRAGEAIAEDQPMVEVMTDKATVEIPSPASGTVEALLADEGDVVAVGTEILAIETDADVAGIGSARSNTRTAAVAAGVTAPPSGARVQATPLVRRLAAELGVDLGGVVGSGPSGRITDQDVRDAAGDPGGTPGARAAAPSPQARERERVPLRGMRGQIAQHLTRAAAVPTVTVVEEAELTAVEASRERTGASLLAHLVVAVAGALHEVPQLNAVIDDVAGEIVIRHDISLGIAVQTDAGLVVPVLRDADALALEDVDGCIAELAEDARVGHLTPDRLRGGSFTITSAGKLGGLFTTPLLNVPEVAILGLHRAEERAVVRDGEIVVRRMANISVTFDHRALDGVTASRFLLEVIERLH